MRRTRSFPARLLTALLVGALLLGLVPMAARPAPVAAAAGAPLLILIDSAANPYSTYLQEILNAEGVKDYEVRNLSELTGALLGGRRAVILGESSPSPAQVATLDSFVSAGGGLIALRPAAALDAVLGVARQGTATGEGYIRVTDPTLGAGLYADTMQFHGTASHYTLAGASELAALYADRTAAANRPAIGLANRGSGKAAFFSYDLARSVVLTRQGNPANADLDVDGDGVIRSIDLYRNWADLERTSVPQADIQQRLLVRLIETVSAQPLPRLWYFPDGAPTVLVATGDAHANPDSYYQTEIDALTQIGAKLTFYISPAGNPSASQVAAWRAQGFDFAPHPYVSCGYDCGFDNAFSWFQSTFGFAPRTVRTHQVRWAGWTAAASVGADHGVGLDLNSYQWGPWLTTASGAPALGYLNGGGQPMRYIDASGAILPIYQQHTTLVDEELAPDAGNRGLSLAQAVAASRQVIDGSVGGYYTPIATQYHVDYFYPNNSNWAIQSTQYALQQGAISLTAASWLSFIEQRAATTVTNTAWSGTALSFTVGSGGTRQRMLVPLHAGGRILSGVTVGGSAVSYSTTEINGTAFALVPVQSGNYVATYATDTTAPTITTTSPASGATNVPTSAPVGVTFSEAMDRPATQGAFSLNPSVAGSFAWNANGTALTFTPGAALAANATYTATVSTAARDLAGNPLAAPTNWSFTTAAAPSPPVVSGVSPISGPVAGGTSVAISGSAFTGATAVSFGGTAASAFTVNSPTAITATAPAHAAGTVDIVVTTPSGTSATGPADRYTYIDQSGTLSIAAVDPGTGPTGGGGTVTIAGANFASGATVSFGGVAATGVTVTSTTTLTAAVPPHPAGAVTVTVTNPGGQSANLTNGYTYVTCPSGCLTQTTAPDFAGGTAGPGTVVGQTADGEVILAPAAGAEFGGAALPPGWSAAPWGGGGGAVVGGGAATIDGALVATDAYYGAGRTLEFVATFSPTAPYQHIGLGTDLNSAPWAIFSTGFLGGTLYARTNNGGSQIDTPLGGGWLGAPHRFRIEWTASAIVYSIDGVQVASHALAVGGQLRPVLSDGAVGNGTLSADWVRLTPYAASGVFTSRVLDAAGSATWGTAAWSASVPSGTSLAVSVRQGNTPTPDGTWSAFAPLANGATVGGTARYLQYQISLATTAADQTPLLRDITFGYTVSGPVAPTVTGVNLASGPTAGGTAVTVTGTNFVSGATVTFGGVAATNVAVVSATSITATTPAHAAGPVDVAVANPGGASGTLPNGFVYAAAAPTVTAINPASGPTTGGTVVTLTGSGFTGATAVAFGGTAASAFTVTSDTAISATAPPRAAGAVNVTVTTPAGTSPAAAGNQFTYQQPAPAPQVRGVSPGTGTTAGGATVLIEGINLGGATGVTFGGAAATFTQVSAVALSAVVPAHAAGTVDVLVTTGGGTSAANPAARYTYVTCPSGCITHTTSAQFAGGSVGAGSYLAQRADGEVILLPAAGAEFGGAALPPGWSAAPWAAGGGASVSGGALTVDSALVATDAYFTPGRALEFVATFDAAAPFQHAGLGIDLNGTPWAIFSTGGSGGALYARSNASSQFDTLIPGDWLGAPHRFRIVWTATTITYAIDGTEVASHAIGNTGDLRPVISDGALGGGTLRIDWLELGPHAASGSYTSPVLDAGGPATWGTVAWSDATPTGTTLAVSVRAGNTPTPDGSWSAFAPVANGAASGATGRYLQYQVGLSTSDPTQTPTFGDITLAYAPGPAAPPPTVAALNPNAGPTAGGTAVTITGTNFVAGATVTFGGIAATNVSVASATSITATTPARAAGAATVTVTNPDGQAASLDNGFTYAAAPTIAGISPSGGPIAGDTQVTITGTNFVVGATTVTFDGLAATNIVVTSATQLTARTPAHAAGAVGVVVTTTGGASAAATYTYTAPPTVTDVTPNSGRASGGTAVTITGTNLTGATAVTFGGVAATAYTVTSATRITATTPPGTGTVDVAVTTPGGLATAPPAERFTYVPAPTVSAVSPTSGPTGGGTAVTITGANFAAGATVRFGSTAATNITVVSATSITATTPARAAGAVAVTVTNPDGQAGSLANGYTFRAQPTITSLTPSSGALAGDTQVTIRGSGFAANATTVTFDGLAGTSVAVASATQLTVRTPAHAAGAVNVVVTTTGGASAAATYTYVPPPTIADVSPNVGPLAGTTVTITGTNLSGATRVRFGTVNATSYSVTSPTSITATAPSRSSAATVDVEVTTPGGVVLAPPAERFTYVAAPTVTGLSPNTGPASGGTVVTISGANLAGATAVTFGAVDAPGFTFVNNNTQIRVAAPAGAAGQVAVRVTTPGGTSTATITTQNRYTYTATGGAAPTVADAPRAPRVAARRRSDETLG